MRHDSMGLRAQRVTKGLALSVFAIGLWAFFLPESFYLDFPLSGADWVSTLGPYDEHLMRDFGSAQVGLGLALWMAAHPRHRDGLAAILVGLSVFGGLHLGYHLTVFDRFGPLSTLLQATALALLVVVPILLLLSIRQGVGSAGPGMPRGVINLRRR